MNRNVSYQSVFFIISTYISACLAAADTSGHAGEAVTSRYWDCCKPSCGWNEKAHFTSPIPSCNARDNILTDFYAGTACNGGSAYACTNQSPWSVNETFSYGFAGAYIQKHVEDYWCCACYHLKFKNGPAEGKEMIVQAHNTAYDVTTSNRFILAVPGGNTSYAGACAKQFDVPETVFGQPWEGVSDLEDCDNLPKPLRDGCRWRFDWFQNADYLDVDYKRVTCPTELTNITQCIRDDDQTFTSAAFSLRDYSPFQRCMFGVIVASLVMFLS
ncbi:glycoside hydrolase family 45 protein [Patellaria atrata CBS 101060]|uniref:cellulase n=1 Tax=Patellaria atrata CBS 101060 TaxID=1346257 RepID=A0A9P4S3Q9_9PEZI|nr:glycoside hydrolase family 45 protein [Patellaria atrata CBS 101060]